jgi:hypothetical protein
MPSDKEDVLKEETLDEEQVNTKRVELLSIIESVSNSVELSNEERGRQLRSYKRDYNAVVDRLHAMNEPRRFDPLDKLPVEIWQTILYQVVSPFFQPHSRLFYQVLPNSIFLFMLVSKRWLDFIVNTPFLWTTVTLSADIPDNVSRVKMHLELSKGLPIYLRIAIPLAEWIEVAPFLAENRHRIIYIQITPRKVVYGDSAKALTEVHTYLGDLLPLPALQRFDLLKMEASTGTASLAQRLLTECPSLTCLMGFNLTKETLVLNSAHRLRRFHTTQDLASFVQKCFPNLDLIIFTDSKTTQTDNQDIGNHLLTWWNLAFTSPQIAPPPLTLVSKLINLVTFESSINGPVLKELFCRLYLMPRLKKLNLRITFEERYKTELPSDTDIRSCDSATILSIRFNSDPRNPVGHVNVYFDRVQELIIKALPSVEELTVQSPRTIPIQFMDSRSFPRLLNLYLESIPEPTTTITLSPSIRNLYFMTSYNWLLGFMKYSSSSMHRMSLDSWIPSRSSDNSGDQGWIDPDKWPALISLTISAHQIAKISTGFEHLRALSLRISSYAYGSYDFMNDSITRFCRTFAMNTTRLPVLESLSLNQLPEWDIFFIMLERRNITKAQGISKLKKITLPDFYPKEIFGPIQDLIRGKFATRPSNRDLSFAGNLELIEDATM